MFHVWDFPNSSTVHKCTEIIHSLCTSHVLLCVMTCSLVGLCQCASGAAVHPGKSYFQIRICRFLMAESGSSNTKAIPFEVVIYHLHLQSSQHISWSAVYMEFLHLSGTVTWDIPGAGLNFSVIIRYVELGCLYSCVASGFRHLVDENCAILGYCAASSGYSLTTFRENLPVPSLTHVLG